MSQEPADNRFDDITIFTTDDGATRVEVRFQKENVWLTQKLMAELYECSTDNVGRHLKHIFAERELDPAATTEECSVVRLLGFRLPFVLREIQHTRFGERCPIVRWQNGTQLGSLTP
jgi:hypothetical protein